MALIDQIADQCGLFISDLKAQDNYSVIAEVLTQIDPDSFPVTDWNTTAWFPMMKSYGLESFYNVFI